MKVPSSFLLIFNPPLMSLPPSHACMAASCFLHPSHPPSLPPFPPASFPTSPDSEYARQAGAPPGGRRGRTHLRGRCRLHLQLVSGWMGRKGGREGGNDRRPAKRDVEKQLGILITLVSALIHFSPFPPLPPPQVRQSSLDPSVALGGPRGLPGGGRHALEAGGRDGGRHGPHGRGFYISQGLRSVSVVE